MKNRFLAHVAEVENIYRDSGNINIARKQKDYLRDQYEFFGIQMKPRRALQKEINAMLNLREDDFLLFTKACYASPYRDLHHYAIDTISEYKKTYTEKILPVVEFMITHHAWWDTVDSVNSYITRHFFIKDRDAHRQTVRLWMQSSHLWLRRSAIISQLKFREQTDEKLLEECIQNNLGSNEFFINKAIGWALREYGNTCPDFVFQIADRYPLNDLSRREALRKLNDF